MGRVAYLSHSKYGTNKEINVNNNSNYKTGYSALPSLNQQTYPGTSGDGATYNSTYNTEIGYLASTTGNISGIYDMSGDGAEYLASHIDGMLESSGFSTTTLANYDSKYFDVYNASSALTTYQYRILGDATGELSSFFKYNDNDGVSRYHSNWYKKTAHFLTSSSPWFYRGGYYGNGSIGGIFHFSRDTGTTNAAYSFRIVLTP